MRFIIISLVAGLLLASCAPEKQKRTGDIEKLETSLKESSKKGIADTTKVKELLADYESYVKDFPKDSVCAIYLMRSAQFYESIMNYDRAIACYEKVQSNYILYPKCNYALFSEAFIYEDKKHDLLKAGLLYKEYLSRYPATKLAESAGFALRNLGKSPEQIISEMDTANKATQNGDPTTKK